MKIVLALLIFAVAVAFTFADEVTVSSLVASLKSERAETRAAAHTLTNVDLQKLPDAPAQLAKAAKPLLDLPDHRVRAAADALAGIDPENQQLLISNPGLRRP